MKIALVLLSCVILVGCGSAGQKDAEILSGLEAIKQNLATNHPTAIRWAFASRTKIESAIDDWSQAQIAKAIEAEVLSPEQVEKLKQYEALSSELSSRQNPYINPTTGLPMVININPNTGLPRAVDPSTGFPVAVDPRTGNPVAVVNTNEQSKFESLSARVREARASVAFILDRREREAYRIRHQYTPEQLVAEYAGDRFDLVVDSREPSYSSSTVLYQRSGEATDITDGVLKLLRSRLKP